MRRTQAQNGVGRRTLIAGMAASGALAAPFASRLARAQGAPLKVGVIHPTSGFLAQIGQACNRGAEVAVPILKDMGYPAVELLFGDTESNPDIARAAGERLINGGAQVLVGAFDSGQTTTLAQVAEQRGIPLVINIAAAPPITEQGYKFVFRNFPRVPEIVAGTFDVQKQLFAATGKSPTKAVVLHVNDTYGTAMRGGLSGAVPNMGMPYQVSDYIAYDPQARDLSVEVTKAKASGAELLITVSRLNDAILITREMAKQRYEPWGIIAAGPGFYEGAYMTTLGKLGNFPISTVPWYDPAKPLARTMRDTHLKMFPGAPVDTNTVFTFEAVMVCADAYKRAGSAAPQALAEAIRATNIKNNAALSDGIAFDAKGQNNGIKIAGIQNFDGATKVVIPVASAEDKIVFPAPGWQARG
jgi:branched-chain amino acid transport system substrate-binding protein